MIQWYSKGKKSVINPKHFAPKDLNFVKLGVMVFVKRVYIWMRAAANNVVIEKSEGVVGALNFFTTKDGLAVFHSYFGAPAAVGLAEALIAGGIKKLVIFGEAGAINPKISIGELLIPTFAIREEGASYHYLPLGVAAKPSQRLRGRVKALLDKAGFPYEEGGVWTTDAFLRETRDKILRCRSQGALAVEMECSALFAVAQYRRAKSAALLLITDELHGRVWKPAYDDQKVINNERKIAEILTKNWLELL